MTRLGGVKNNLGGGGASPGAVGDRRGTIALRDLAEEAQRAFEIVDALKKLNEPVLLRKLLERADAGHGPNEPASVRGLRNIAALYERLGMKLDAGGVARFKQERGLTGGTMAGPVARAYVKALDGQEILVWVSRAEEATLRPSEKSCLAFLRELAKRCDATALRPVKHQLKLNNPRPLTDDAAGLANEYVGLTTVKEIAQASTLRSTPLTREGMHMLAEVLAREAKAYK
jgi:hypothetical protein